MKYTDKQEDLLLKFASGTCAANEARQVIAWFKEPEKHLNLYQGLVAIWNRECELEDDVLEAENLDSVLDKLHHNINIFSELEEQKSRRGILFIRILSRIAAVLFIPLLITTLLFVRTKIDSASGDSHYTEIHVTHGSKLNTQLPDGTQVWLNSGSTLKYPQSFSRRNRQVMVSGEAYFDVAHNESHPFVVSAGNIDFRVLGTKFNVMAYPEEANVSATLEQGKISVELLSDGRKTTRLCFLEPGEHIEYRKDNGSTSKSFCRTDKYTSWKDGKLIFRNDPLSQVIKRLERWYSVEIEIIGDHKLPETPYTMTIEDEAITQVLEYLSVASPISWEVIPSKRKEDGEFTRTRYIIRNINATN